LDSNRSSVKSIFGITKAWVSKRFSTGFSSIQPGPIRGAIMQDPSNLLKNIATFSAYLLLALTATLIMGFAANAQVLAPKLEAVATNQAYIGLTLELAMYEYEGDRRYGRQATGSKVITKRSSSDPDPGPAVELPIGKQVVICVFASQTGTLTLWSQLDDQQPDKIYPNAFTPSVKGAGPINANEEVCVGDTPAFRLRVAGQPGQLDRVYAHWAPLTGGQLDASDFPAIGRAARSSRTAATYGSATVVFRVGP
jgi:hypothetical protein